MILDFLAGVPRWKHLSPVCLATIHSMQMFHRLLFVSETSTQARFEKHALTRISTVTIGTLPSPNAEEAQQDPSNVYKLSFVFGDVTTRGAADFHFGSDASQAGQKRRKPGRTAFPGRQLLRGGPWWINLPLRLERCIVTNPGGPLLR